MRARSLIFIANVLFALSGCTSSAPLQAPAATQFAFSDRGAYLIPASVDLYRLLPPPPEAGSAQERAELDELLRLQATRTPAAVRRALEDATVSIFRFADALGSPPQFNPRQLPLTNELFARIGQDEGLFMNPAKDAFGRPRPFVTDRQLAPVVPKPASASYPSGHSTWAVASAIVLADMVPERRAQIFARADEYAHNREVGGVHYPSDVAAGHLAGTVLAEALFDQPRFVTDERAAAAELRAALGLPPLSTQPLARHAAPQATCNRACLSAVMTDYLAALQAGNAARLRIIAPVHFTEDQTQRVFGKEGIWSSHVELTDYRFDIIDVHAGTAAALVKVKIDGAPSLLALRLLTQGGRITGVESIAVHSRDEGMIFKTDAIQKLSAAMAYTPTPPQRNSREEMIAAAAHYPRGLQTGSFEKVDAPFAEDAYRFENGQLMAGPGCTFFQGCEHIKSQKIPTLSKLVYRIAAVDEEQGIVLIRMDFGAGSVFEAPNRPKDQSLSVFEAFKVYGGQIHAVEAFMKVKPAAQPLGWDD
jgi:acid phosphatase (class A)